MTYTAVDCQGFAGGFTLGVVQAGFELIAKREMRQGFGVRNCTANRHLLGDSWDVETVDPASWTVPAVTPNLVFGNPPCSGFSVLSTKSFRGADSKINHCMWAFVEYAARCMPQVAIFESVPLAYSQGRSLMTALHARLEELTGESWTLHHILHNALSVGGPSMRRRYFWVASRVPFGVEWPDRPNPIPTLRDAIGDLEYQPISWEEQPYVTPHVSRWILDHCPRRVDPRVVDGHAFIDNPHTRRTRELLDSTDWFPGEHSQLVTQRYFDEHGDLPPGWQHLVDKLKGQAFFQGYNTPTMWRPDEPARVITGAGPLNGIHWSQRRPFTHREVARIMGFPDAWLINPLRGTPGLMLTWGKGITVQCGRWIAEWVRRALDGAPGSYSGDPVGDREYLIDVTNAWKRACGTVKLLTHPVIEGTTIMTETAVAEDTTSRAGRPRPQETQDRDEQVFAALEGPMTKQQLVEKLVDLKASYVYLSLYRLRKASRVERTRGENGAHVWTRVEPAAG